MCDPVTIMAVATAASVGASYASMEQSKKASRTQEAMQRVRQQREQMQALRESQIQRAMLTQRSVNSGVADSSGFAGGMSSLASQLGSNQMFANQMGSMSSAVSRYERKAQTYGALSQLFGQVGSFAMSAPGSDFINNMGNKTNTVTPNQTSSLYASQLGRGAGLA